ncbi:MAG: aminotransferase class I/II-fold pyridoxal phosphate-dependent enzyme [Candidatus Peribacteraceae bacterium]|nr:aminotransferase class I/II-fold pyridoxal phosphate-dependent enzyme [Candidatus Peribacteraceae bacterium]
MQLSKRIANLAGYPFAELEKIITQLKDQGIEPIDFGVGDPVDPTPEFIREATKQAVDDFAASGYPSYIGSAEFREAVKDWFNKRFAINLNPETEIASSIGSKEAIFNFPLAFIDQGDVVLIPTPGYPPYARGTEFAGGKPYFLPLLAENNFLIDFEKIPDEVVKRAKILWLNYPNSPTGVNAPDEFFEQAVKFCAENDIILASDLAYSEIHFDAKPKSILEFTRENVIEFHSLSKRSRMTGYRVGFVVGDPKIVDAFKKVKTNIDSGTPNFLQAAAIAALSDEKHVLESIEEYREKRDILTSAFEAIGLPKCVPEATFYVWQKVPGGMTSEEFAKKLLAPEIAVVATPGAWISDTIKIDSKSPLFRKEGVGGDLNPGEGYVRFALVPTVEKVREAAERIKSNLKI